MGTRAAPAGTVGAEAGVVLGVAVGAEVGTAGVGATLVGFG
jgi:hypothetical protein